MTLIPITCEARIMGFKKESRADGDWTELRIHIHPDDTPHALFLLPLKTHIMLSIKGTDEGAAETADEHSTPEATETPEEPERLKGGARAKRAGILCGDAGFHRWYIGSLAGRPDAVTIAAMTLREKCGVKSRAELDHNEDAGRIFDRIVTDYYASQRGETPKELARQAAEGPG